MEAEQQVNILLVDDRQENLLVMEAVLSDLGQKLVFARTGRDALRFLLDEDVAVILLDVQMPGLDGFETAELIRGRERTQHTPIIFITAVSTNEESVFQGYSLGAVDYITKPFEPAILRSKVKFFIDFYRQKLSIQRQGELLAQANRELDQMNAALEARVLERTAQLQAANRALEAEIAERKQAEDSLRQSKDLLQAIIDNTTAVVCLKDVQGCYLLANRRYKELCHVGGEEVVGRTDYDYHPKEIANVYRENDLQVLSANQAMQFEETVLHDDGLHSYIALKFPLYNGSARPYGVCSISTDITDRKRVEEQIKASLKEKEVLLQEIHHRVKNNLQIISSLLNLQSSHITNEEAREKFKESKNRIKSMAIIHEKLYQSKNLSEINFANYISSLLRYLLSSYEVDSNIKLKTDVDNVLVNIDKAIPCGLIINELISNALKHAFPDGRKGEMSIKFGLDSGCYTLIISNDGVPFPDGVDFRNTKSLGLQLVCALTEQLRGTIELDKSSGTEFRIRFNLGGVESNLKEYNRPSDNAGI